MNSTLLATLVLLAGAREGELLAESEPVAVEEAAASTAADKKQSAEFLILLNEVTGKTNAAHERVDRVRQIIDEIQGLVQRGEASVEESIEATTELTGLLKSNLDTLHRDAITVRDRLGNEVIPEYKAIRANVKARLELTKEDDPDYREMRDIFTKSAENVQALEANLARLDQNVKRIAEASLRLCDRLDILALWNLVDLSAAELIDRLNEFNLKVEQIARDLDLDKIEP